VHKLSQDKLDRLQLDVVERLAQLELAAERRGLPVDGPQYRLAKQLEKQLTLEQWRRRAAQEVR